MSENIVSLKNVSYSYTDYDGAETRVLKNINLSIKKGEYVVILGHNGSGKSTLCKLLNRIIIPSDGDVVCFGINTRDESKELELRKNVQMVFQNPDNQLVEAIVEEDVAFGPSNLGIKNPELRNIVDKSLEDVEMSKYALKAPHELSGGQKQRIAIAGVLAIKPKLIIFDEATAMLDPIGRKEILGEIDYLNKKKGITVVNVTHHMKEATLASRVIVLDDGEIKLDGSPREVFSNLEKITSFGLDVPQSLELYFNLKSRGFKFSNDTKVPLNPQEFLELI
ncbi:energy-coupling factor transporter ATPase [Citroniella saccharovorans]|uniref:Energy-coupling factor transporter ATPase n=1 Tax=Citroniella saccharovorans TaxID=2053367 RepID=A0AAW9MSC1_9FIRM|nr:energy-coupling factor transporter ATPase [Citroniella saccharovorans]MEB3430069.1 energy-coupling factor transporter ATPase [Citroniella saccharovorans]